MIAAAVTLFARSGFHGVTTRDIARSARVSEGNIFRYFPSKRDLFLAAIDSQLGKLQMCAEPLVRLLEEDDSRVALRGLFELITKTVVRQPELVRLLHFSVLEFGPDVEPVFRRHLDGLIAAASGSFERWTEKYGFQSLSPQVTLMSFVATVVLLQCYPVFSGAALPFPSVESAAAQYAELWHRVLAEGAGAAALANEEERVNALGD
jgi:AcrR family transcriptional regulator